MLPKLYDRGAEAGVSGCIGVCRMYCFSAYCFCRCDSNAAVSTITLIGSQIGCSRLIKDVVGFSFTNLYIKGGRWYLLQFKSSSFGGSRWYTEQFLCRTLIASSYSSMLTACTINRSLVEYRTTAGCDSGKKFNIFELQIVVYDRPVEK